ncbi:LANO_0E01134g1_1 [Lachancea nothofagi CBS 11611]|uniref:LANO_0E01134g1_1 n=1 Tax=Lachancea nothofagi CBS 11611 TaxID=1266666 RepID=A0A1G4JP54_9SACH|nr:LANO_0E01134g1_1 [Lachancea nothofagi CBS 11611]
MSNPAQDLTLRYTTSQQELEDLVVARQKLETQLQENKIVQDEFDTLKDDTKVYKLTGNVLLPVEQFEAKNNVSKRLEFISKEIQRCEENIKGSQAALEQMRAELMKAQQAAQA